MLVTNIDIDNDGERDWVVKETFMDNITAYEGSWDGGSDSLTVFRQMDFDPGKQLTSDQLIHGQRPGAPQPRKLSDEVALQLRPFVFKGKVYLSAYQTEWRKRLDDSKRPRRRYPDREYMNILRVTSGGKRPTPYYEIAKTETICRIRMLMLTGTDHKEGN